MGALGLVLALVFVAFFPCLKAEFLVSWDDEFHLLKYKYLHPLNRENIKGIFNDTINEVYLPLTILSFAIEHHFFEFNPFAFSQHRIGI